MSAAGARGHEDRGGQTEAPDDGDLKEAGGDLHGDRRRDAAASEKDEHEGPDKFPEKPALGVLIRGAAHGFEPSLTSRMR